MSKTVWVVTGESESGDHYGPDIFNEEPTEAELAEWCHNCDGHFNDSDEMEDYEDGPGYAGSFVYPEVVEKPVASLKKAAR